MNLAIRSGLVLAVAALMLVVPREGAGFPDPPQRPLPQKPVRTVLRPVDDPRHIEVKFLDQLDVGLDGAPFERARKGLGSAAALSLFRSIAAAGGTWRRMTGAAEEQMEALRETAERNLNRRIAKLNNYFVVTAPPGVGAAAWIDRLNALPEVEIAHPLPLPVPPPVPSSFQTRQGYLNAATTGIGASYAWSVGDSGQNVTICDFEYSWNLSHQDLPVGIQALVPPGRTASDPFGNDNHGTAVLGELVSMNNGWGTTGAAYGSSVKVAPTYLDGFWDVGASLTYAMTQLQAGDVLLIEHQIGGPRYKGIPGNDTGLVPIEWWQSSYDVVVTAVGNGFHVVEAAGNGYQDLDSAVYSSGNGGHWPYLPLNNSGAVIVGAGAVPGAFYGTDTPRARLPFSNYGSRLDLQGWGEMVVTAGYGTLYSSEGTNLLYDSSFAGTSSASPIVAAAVALVESRFEALNGGSAMAPSTMRTLLGSTGSAQQAGTYPVSQRIGPLPDVQTAVNFAGQTLAGGTYTVGATGSYLNLTAVAAALNSKIISGNVIFELQSDYVGTSGETFPVVFLPFTTSGGSWGATVRPASGVSMRTTGGSPPGGYPLIHFKGVDRLTFDGRPGGSGTTIAWTLRHTRKDSLAPTIQLTGGADRNLLTYLQVESENTIAASGTVLIGKPTDLVGNKANTVSHSLLRDRSDVAGSSPANALLSPAMETATNDSNVVTGNEIFNWSAAGVSLSGRWWTVSGNSLYETGSQGGPLTGIQLNSGGGHAVLSNIVGGSSAQGGGAPLQHTGTTAFTGIQLTVDTLAASSVQGNRITNIFSTNPGFAAFLGMAIYGGAADIGTTARNIIGDSAGPNGIVHSGTGIAGGINVNSPFPGRVNVVNNLIANVSQISSSPGEFRAINILGLRKASVRSNEIRASGPVLMSAANAVYGIFASGVNDTTLIANNMVTLAEGAPTAAAATGICDAGSFGPQTVEILFNSVYIGGTAAGGGATYAYRRDGGTLTTLRDNILCNVRGGGPAPHVALGVLGAPLLPGTSDVNILFTANAAQLVSLLGAPMGLAAWQGASGCDLSSFNADPRYLTPLAGNLHINPSAFSPADNAGSPQPPVTDDFDGQARGVAPDIGADEYAINAPGTFSLLMPANASTGRPGSGFLRWQPSAAAGRYDVYLDSLSPPASLVSADQSDTAYAYAGLDSNETYYWSVTAENSGGSLAASGSPWSFSTGAAGGLVTRTCSVTTGWNLLSVPLMTADARTSTLFPAAVTKAYSYVGRYVESDTLQHCVGYWLKFDSAHNADIEGYECSDESVGVAGGWNMIGAINAVIPFAGLASSPPGITSSNLFGYDGTTYVVADSLRPGRGYWVKVSQAGTLYLRTSGALAGSRIRIVPDDDRPPRPPEDVPVADRSANLPVDFALEQNYPNPFNPSTTIRFDLPVAAAVSLKVYDLLGREVATLCDARAFEAGWQSVVFVASSVSSGVYLYRLEAGSFRAERLMTILR